MKKFKDVRRIETKKEKRWEELKITLPFMRLGELERGCDVKIKCLREQCLLEFFSLLPFQSFYIFSSHSATLRRKQQCENHKDLISAFCVSSMHFKAITNNLLVDQLDTMDLPVISSGMASPITSKTVGATSQRAPSLRTKENFLLVITKGTGKQGEMDEFAVTII